jgi:hypothetical protein
VRGDDHEIAFSKLHEMVEIGGNPLLGCLLPLFDQSGSGSLGLREYQFALAQMAPSQPDMLRYNGAPRGSIRIGGRPRACRRSGRQSCSVPGRCGGGWRPHMMLGVAPIAGAACMPGPCC